MYRGLLFETDTPGEWRWHPHEKCVICGEFCDSECGTYLPYGSSYDGQFLCSKCLVPIIDPIIKKRRGRDLLKSD